MFNSPFSGTTQVSEYQKGKTNLDFTETSDSEWQWHQLGHMQVCTLLQTDNYASTPPLSFLQAGCPSCRPTNSVKALKALTHYITNIHISILLLDLNITGGNGLRLHVTAPWPKGQRVSSVLIAESLHWRTVIFKCSSFWFLHLRLTFQSTFFFP